MCAPDGFATSPLRQSAVMHVESTQYLHPAADKLLFTHTRTRPWIPNLFSAVAPHTPLLLARLQCRHGCDFHSTPHAQQLGLYPCCHPPIKPRTPRYLATHFPHALQNELPLIPNGSRSTRFGSTEPPVVKGSLCTHHPAQTRTVSHCKLLGVAPFLLRRRRICRNKLKQGKRVRQDGAHA